MKNLDKTFFTGLFLIIFIFLGYYLFTTSFFPCLFHKITGLYCPGCGITRMFISLFKLNFYQAFRYNPFAFILLILTLIYQTIKLIINHFSTNKIHLNNYIYITLLVLTICFGIIRNIPYFSYLIPTIVK